MTIARYEPDETPSSVVQQQANMQTQAVQRLADWAQAAIAAHEVAESLVQTSFVPDAFKGQAGEATAAILAGSEVGLSPLASLRSFDLINGTAAPRAITLRAIIQSQGHEVWVKESTATRAIVCGRRRGTTTVEQSQWTLERAESLGLKGKDNWRKQPTAMLVARATAEVCRLIAADAILGIGYTTEEVQDGADLAETPTVEPVQPAATRKMSRRKPEPTPEPESITDAQQKKIHASFNDLGIINRDQQLDYIARAIGHPIESSKDVTKVEAGQLIDALEADVLAAVPALNQPDEQVAP